MKEKLKTLFEDIQQILDPTDIAYHEVLENGALKPFYKTNIDKLTPEQWEEVHSKIKLNLNDDPVLAKLLTEKEPLIMSDVDGHPNPPEAFKTFGIKSNLVYPVRKDNRTVGLVVIAYIARKHEFTDKEVSNCGKLVEIFNKNF